jgi:hypothetical protein
MHGRGLAEVLGKIDKVIVHVCPRALDIFSETAQRNACLRLSFEYRRSGVAECLLRGQLIDDRFCDALPIDGCEVDLHIGHTRERHVYGAIEEPYALEAQKFGDGFGLSKAEHRSESGRWENKAAGFGAAQSVQKCFRAL